MLPRLVLRMSVPRGPLLFSAMGLFSRVRCANLCYSGSTWTPRAKLLRWLASWLSNRRALLAVVTDKTNILTRERKVLALL